MRFGHLRGGKGVGFLGTILAAIAIALRPAFAVDPVTIEFQQGGVPTGAAVEWLGGFDTTLNYAGGSPTPVTVGIDGVNNGNTDERQYFVLFDQIFGSGPGLIPLGATILDANLTLTTTGNSNAQSNGRFIVAGMTVPFTSAATLSDLGTYDAAVPTNGPTYANGNATLATGGFKAPTQNAASSAFVAPVVQGWSNGSLANNGLVVQAHTTDAWQIYGNGDATVAYRPKLSVTYTTAPTTTTSLVPGVGGYDGVTIVQMDGVTDISLDVTDTTGFYVDGPTGGTPPGDAGSPDLLALVKFADIFGSGVNQVPARAEILKGYFVATTNPGGNNQSAGPFSLYRMTAPWDASTLYSSYGPAGPVAGTDYDAAAIATVEPMERNQQAWFDITDDIEAWHSGADNNGLMIRSSGTTDGWNFAAAGNTDPNRRPDLRVTYSIDPLVWRGNLSSEWDRGPAVGSGGTNNWQLEAAGTATNFIDTDHVVFDDSAAGSGDVSVTISGAVAPQLVTLDAATRAYAFSGTGGITGAGRLVKRGLATATFETANDFSGGTTVSAGTLRVGAGGSAGSIGGPIAVASGATLEFDRTGSLALAGTLSGDGSLVTNGAGQITITGDHTFAGAIAINAGSLGLSPFTHTGSVTVADGATFVAASGLEPATLSTASLTLGSTASGLGFDLQSPTNPAVPLLSVTQADGLVLAGGAHTISVATAGALQPGRFTLIDYEGSPIAAGFSLASLPPRLAASLIFDTSNTTIDLDVTGTQTPTWVGGVSAVWDSGTAVDVGGTANFVIAGLGAATNFVTGDQVIFDDTASQTSVTLAGTLAPGSVRVDNSAVDYVFTGAGSIGGAALLTKAGTGTLTLLAANESTAGLAVTAGTLVVGDATTAASVSGPVAVDAAGTFTVRQGTVAGPVTVTGGRAEVVAGSLTGGGTVSAGTLAIGTGGTGAALVGDVAIATSGTLAFDMTDEITYAEALSGDGAVIKAGSGRLVLTGISPFTGSLTIDGGSVVLDDQSVGGDLDATSIVVNAGGIFQFGNNTAGNPDLPDTTYLTANAGGSVIWQEGEQVGGINLAGGLLDLQQGGFNASGVTAQQWTAGTLTGTGANAQVLNGSAAIDKTGPGTVTITGNASITVTGGVAIREGVLLHAAAANLGSSNIALGGDTTTGTFGYGGVSASRSGVFTIGAGGGGIEVTDPAATLALTGHVTGAGTLTKTGPGTLALIGTVDATGPLAVDAGTLAVAPYATATGVAVADGATFAVTYGATPVTMSVPQVSLGSAGSTLGFALSGAGNPTSPLLQVTGPDGLSLSGGAHTLAVASVQSLSTGRFTLIDYEGSGISSGFNVLLPPRVTGSLVYDTTATTIDLDITGTGQVKWAGGVSGDWDTGTAIDVGGTANWIDTSSAAATNFVAGDRALFDDSAATGSVTLAAIQDAAEVAVDNTSLDYTFAGPGSLGGAGLLTKRGVGRLTLAAADARTGGTTVSGGTLAVGTSDTTGSLAGPVTVDFGGTLEVVNGTVASAVTIAGGTARLAGGDLAGGASVGSGELVIGPGTLAGNLDVAAGGQITVDRADDLAYAATLSGAGAVIMNGAGTLALLGYNRTFTGSVIVNAGTVLVDDLGAGGDLYASSIVVNAGGTFRFGPNGNADFPANTLVTINADGLYEHQQGENFGGITLDGGEFRFSGDTKTGVNFTADSVSGLDLRSGSITTAFTGAAAGGEIRAASTSVLLEKTTAGTVVLGPGVTLSDTLPVNVREGTLAMDIAAFEATGSGEVLLGDAGAATLRADGAGAGTHARYTYIGAAGATIDVADAGGTLTATALLDGVGTLTKAGPGTLVIAGVNATLTGATTVAAGTLELTDAGGLAASPITVAGGTLRAASTVIPQAPSLTVQSGTLDAGALTVGPGGLGSLAINGGAVTGNPTLTVLAGGTVTLSDTTRISVTATAFDVDESAALVDIGAGELRIAAGGATAEQLRADILAGRNGGAWNGAAGITSAAAAASGGTRAVGYFVSGDGSARVSFAAPGDGDLSGQVNVFDLLGMDSAGKFGTGQPSVWGEGDFNYDSVTNIFDLLAIDTAGAYGAGNYFPSAPTANGVAGTVAAVPEPAVGVVAVVAALAVAGGWRRRRAERRFV